MPQYKKIILITSRSDIEVQYNTQILLILYHIRSVSTKHKAIPADNIYNIYYGNTNINIYMYIYEYIYIYVCLYIYTHAHINYMLFTPD